MVRVMNRMPKDWLAKGDRIGLNILTVREGHGSAPNRRSIGAPMRCNKFDEWNKGARANQRNGISRAVRADILLMHVRIH
jgi:hypothetical protein